MPLIDAVKNSLDANGLEYSSRLVVLPANTIIAHVNTKGGRVDCIAVAEDRTGVLSVILPYGEPVEATRVTEVKSFVLGCNQELSLGHLTIDVNNIVTYEEGIVVSYMANPNAMIADFILQTGLRALNTFILLAPIIEGDAKASDVLAGIEAAKRDPLRGFGRFN